jgi:hypothetical protein
LFFDTFGIFDAFGVLANACAKTLYPPLNSQLAKAIKSRNKIKNKYLFYLTLQNIQYIVK